MGRTNAATGKLGGEIELLPWRRIRERCRQVRADAAHLQGGMPEQIGLTYVHLAPLCGEPGEHPLTVLEHEVAQSGGIANANAIRKALANVDEIWGLFDDEGAMVATGSTIVAGQGGGVYQ